MQDFEQRINSVTDQLLVTLNEYLHNHSEVEKQKSLDQLNLLKKEIKVCFNKSLPSKTLKELVSDDVKELVSDDLVHVSVGALASAAGPPVVFDGSFAASSSVYNQFNATQFNSNHFNSNQYIPNQAEVNQYQYQATNTINSTTTSTATLFNTSDSLYSSNSYTSAPTYNMQSSVSSYNMQPSAPSYNMQSSAPTYNMQPNASSYNVQPTLTGPRMAIDKGAAERFIKSGLTKTSSPPPTTQNSNTNNSTLNFDSIRSLNTSFAKGKKVSVRKLPDWNSSSSSSDQNTASLVDTPTVGMNSFEQVYGPPPPPPPDNRPPKSKNANHIPLGPRSSVPISSAGAIEGLRADVWSQSDAERHSVLIELLQKERGYKANFSQLGQSVISLCLLTIFLSS